MKKSALRTILRILQYALAALLGGLGGGAVGAMM